MRALQFRHEVREARLVLLHEEVVSHWVWSNDADADAADTKTERLSFVPRIYVQCSDTSHSDERRELVGETGSCRPCSARKHRKEEMSIKQPLFIDSRDFRSSLRRRVERRKEGRNDGRRNRRMQNGTRWGANCVLRVYQ